MGARTALPRERSHYDDDSCTSAKRRGHFRHDREDQVVPRRRSLTSTLYRDARDRGNVGAAKYGRRAHQGRVVHKRVLKTSNGVVQRGLRKVGLWR